MVHMVTPVYLNFLHVCILQAGYYPIAIPFFRDTGGDTAYFQLANGRCSKAKVP